MQILAKNSTSERVRAAAVSLHKNWKTAVLAERSGTSSVVGPDCSGAAKVSSIPSGGGTWPGRGGSVGSKATGVTAAGPPRGSTFNASASCHPQLSGFFAENGRGSLLFFLPAFLPALSFSLLFLVFTFYFSRAPKLRVCDEDQSASRPISLLPNWSIRLSQDLLHERPRRGSNEVGPRQPFVSGRQSSSSSPSTVAVSCAREAALQRTETRGLSGNSSSG